MTDTKKNWKNTFKSIAGAKPDSGFRDRLPLGTHKGALMELKVEQTQQKANSKIAPYDIVEAAFRVLETDCSQVKAGEARNWSWHVGSPAGNGWFGMYESGRCQKFLDAVRRGLGLTCPCLDAEGNALVNGDGEEHLAYDDEPIRDADGDIRVGDDGEPIHVWLPLDEVGQLLFEGELTGMTVLIEVTPKTNDDGAVVKSEKGHAMTNVEWVVEPQTPDEITAMAETLKSPAKVEKAAPAVPAKAAAPAKNGVARQPAKAPPAAEAEPTVAPVEKPKLGQSLKDRMSFGKK